MKKLFTSLAILIACKSYTQEQPLTLTLEQAVAFGLKNRHDIQANKMDLAISSNKILQHKKEWLPNLEGSSDIRYNTRLQTTVLPEDFIGLGRDNYITLGTKNQSSFSLDFTQPLHKPGLNADINIAKKERDLEQERTMEKETDIKLKIVQSYLSAVLTKVQVKLATAVKDRHQSYLNIAEAKKALGASIESDFLKAALEFKNAEFSWQEADNNYGLAIAQLKFNINVDEKTDIIIADSIELIKVEEVQLSPNLAINRTELRQLSIEAEIYGLQLQKAKRYALPTISFYANYTTLFQSNNFNYFKNEFWNPYNSVGVRLSVPITGNIKNQHAIKENRLKMEQSQLKLMHRKAEMENEKNRYITELQNTSLSLRSAENNLQLSENIFRTELNNYSLGVIAYTTILDTEKSLRTAEENYFKAIYNYLLSTMNYQKSIGEL